MDDMNVAAILERSRSTMECSRFRLCRFMPDAKFCRNCGQKRPKLAMLSVYSKGAEKGVATCILHGA